MILNSPTISGSLTVTGNILTSGSITLSGSVASASFASTSSFVALAQSASNAVAAQTASFANTFTVAGNLTAQTLVVQTITSSVDFVTGSTQFGSLLSNTHVFSGSVTMNSNGLFVSSSGNVGIGTTNPTVKLSVSGTIESLTDSAGEGGQIILRGNTFQYGIDNFNGTGLRFIRENDGTGASGIVQMFISSSGNIGIGTIAPTSLLEVQANQNAQTGIRVRNSTSGTSAGVEFGAYTNSGNGGFGKYSTGNTPYKNIAAASTYVYNGSSGDIALLNDVATGNISFAAGGASSAQLFVSASGFVGIGTTTPIGPLMIAVPAVGSAIGAANAQQAFDYSRLRIKHYSDSNLGLSIGYAGANQTYIQTGYNEGSTAPLSLNPFGGNIGIGVTSPSDVLDVRKNQNGITNFYLQNTDTTNTNSRAYLNVVSGNTTLLIASIHSDNTYVKPLTATGLYLGYDNFLKLTGGANIEYNVVPNAYYHIATDNAKISVASSGTLNFGTFSGFIMVNNHSNGYVGIFLCGAGTTSLVSYTGSTSGLGTLAYNGGINGYTWTSNFGSTAFYGFFVIRTRQNA